VYGELKQEALRDYFTELYENACTPSSLKAELETALELTTAGKFPEAVSVFRNVIQHTIVLVQEDLNGDSIRDLCKEYIVALSVEIHRKSLGPLPPPSLPSYSEEERRLLEQMLTLLLFFAAGSALQPRHQLLSERVGLGFTFKYGQWNMAKGFAKRILKHLEEDESAEASLRIHTSKILAACEAQLATSNQSDSPLIHLDSELEHCLDKTSRIRFCCLSHTLLKQREVVTPCSFCYALFSSTKIQETQEHVLYCPVCQLVRIK
jgi:Coatomer (COPI) alpha subunit C-terminus